MSTAVQDRESSIHPHLRAANEVYHNTEVIASSSSPVRQEQHAEKYRLNPCFQELFSIHCFSTTREPQHSGITSPNFLFYPLLQTRP